MRLRPRSKRTEDGSSRNATVHGAAFRAHYAVGVRPPWNGSRGFEGEADAGPHNYRWPKKSGRFSFCAHGPEPATQCPKRAQKIGSLKNCSRPGRLEFPNHALLTHLFREFVAEPRRVWIRVCPPTMLSNSSRTVLCPRRRCGSTESTSSVMETRIKGDLPAPWSSCSQRAFAEIEISPTLIQSPQPLTRGWLRSFLFLHAPDVFQRRIHTARSGISVHRPF